MIDQDSFIMTQEKWKAGIGIEEYNGEYGICACQQGEDGKIYARWVFPQKGKEREPGDKAIPMKLTLGDKDQAVERLQALIKTLQGGDGGYAPDDGGDDIPF